MKTRFFDHNLNAVAVRLAGSRKRAICVVTLLAAMVLVGTVAASVTFVLKWGSSGSGNGQFINPTFVAVDSSGNVYVSDTGNKRIQKFDSSGSFILKWGSSGPGNGQFNAPIGVAVDLSGNVYVVDDPVGNDRVQKFDSNGNFITKWGGPGAGTGNGQFNLPQGVAVDSSSNVYVVDSGNNRIQKFDSNGTFLTKWGVLGSGNGQFNNPKGVAVDSSGNVYVSDTGNARIQKFDSSGTFITKWGSSGSGDGQFDAPIGVAVDSLGDVYVVDDPPTLNNRVQKFDSNGNFITKWGSTGSGDGQFSLPQGVAVDSSFNVYVGDSGNNRIQKFSQNTPPVAQCHNVTLSAGPSCTANASIDNGSFDPDSGDTITLSQSPAGPYPIGTTSVTLTVTDSFGASSQCSSTVTVVDTTAPVITCPGNIITPGNIPDSPFATVNPGTATATDSCSSVTVAGVRSDSQPLNAPYPIGTTTITWTATDAAGNQATCMQTVTVVANTPSNKDQCKHGGWQTFTNPTFRNQGDCVSYVNHH